MNKAKQTPPTSQMKSATFCLWLSKERLPFIQSKVTCYVLKDQEQFVYVRIHLKDDSDALQLFYAGVEYGKQYSTKALTA